MIRRHFFPTWCGDFRLERLESDDEGTCTLTVVDPTAADLDKLGHFLEKARKKGWLSQLAGVAEKGETVLAIGASIVDAGRVLLGRRGRVTEKDGLLTVVRMTNGEVIAVHDYPDEAAAAESEEAEDAATVKRPTLCCPNCTPGPDERASEALRAFCTRRQWESWQRRGSLLCRGNLSGHTYRVAHRHSPIAITQGKCAWDVVDDHVVHCHCSDLPPAEEVLAIKATLEHREHWVRNPSGYFGSGPSYANPFMRPNEQGLDGVVDTRVTSVLGGQLMALEAMGVLRREGDK